MPAPYDDLLLLSIVVLVPVLLILNLFIAYSSTRVPDDKRMVWAIGLVMCNVIAFPVFWYQFIWRVGAAGDKTL